MQKKEHFTIFNSKSLQSLFNDIIAPIHGLSLHGGLIMHFLSKPRNMIYTAFSNHKGPIIIFFK